MILFFIFTIYSELSEKGYLYSVGKKKFLSLDGDSIRIVPKNIMPEMFEIETRPDGSSYQLKIFPVPKQSNRVIDKDWWWNDHKLILHDSNDWQSEHFIFAMVPQHMLKIVVKEKCVEATDDNYVKAVNCRSKKDSINQYYRWFSSKEREIIEDWVVHNGGRIKRHDRYPKRPPRRPPRYDESSDDGLSFIDFLPPNQRRPNRHPDDYYPPNRRPSNDSYDELDMSDFNDYHGRRPAPRPPRRRPRPHDDDYDDYDRYPSRPPRRPGRYDDDYDRYPSRYPQGNGSNNYDRYPQGNGSNDGRYPQGNGSINGRYPQGPNSNNYDRYPTRPLQGPGSNNNYNDPCDQFGCDDNSNNGPWTEGPGNSSGKGPWNGGPGNNSGKGPWNGGPDVSQWTKPVNNPTGPKNHGCDEAIDSIERVICEINSNPAYTL